MDPTDVWVHFEKVENDETRTMCKYCKEVFVVSTDTSLLTHLTSCKELFMYAKMNENLKPLVWCIEKITDVSEEDYICTMTSLGTGFSVSKNGLVMTCAHVVKNANPSTEIKVHTLDNSLQGTAKIAYLRKGSDLALLDVSGIRDCGAVKFSRDRSLSVGQPLVTIGNPPNLVGTFLVGHVCYGCKNVKKSIKDNKATCATYETKSQQKNRVLGDVWNVEVFRKSRHPYEFERSLNPSVPIIQCHGFNTDNGNSGGPVFNHSEELVGMIHASSFCDNIAIHVTELEDFMNEYKKQTS